MRTFIVIATVVAVAFPSAAYVEPKQPFVLDNNGKPIPTDILKQIKELNRRIRISTPVVSTCKVESIKIYPDATEWEKPGAKPTTFVFLCMQSHGFDYAGDADRFNPECPKKADAYSNSYLPAGDPQCWIKALAR